MLIDRSLDAHRPVYLADPVNRSHPLNRGRVAWWLTTPGLEGGGAWPDLMGLCPLTLTAMGNASNGWRGSTRPGGLGHLLTDGAGGRAVSSAAALKVGGGAFSVALWVNRSGPGTVISNEPTGGFRVDSVGNYRFILFTAGGGVAGIAGAAGSAVGIWNRVVATSDGTTATIYLDGVATTGAITSPSGATNSLTLGSGGGTSLAFPGSIDDVSIWSRCLSAAEVVADLDLSRRGYPGALNRY